MFNTEAFCEFIKTFEEKFAISESEVEIMLSKTKVES